MNEEQAIRNFQEMFVPADLHPDLLPYLGHTGHFEALQHPLVYGVPYTPEMNNHYNKRYELMKEEVAKALAEGNIHRYVFMHERPYRLNAFVDCIANRVVPDKDYWELLGSMWIDSENIWQNLNVWKRLMRSPRPRKQFFMDEDERKAFKLLPPQLTIYRGCIRRQNEDGMSWTLDKDKAAWFSKRFACKGESACVLEKTIQKKNVFAYLTGRGESEVIIL
jgi:hypothetical protein